MNLIKANRAFIGWFLHTLHERARTYNTIVSSVKTCLPKHTSTLTPRLSYRADILYEYDDHTYLVEVQHCYSLDSSL